MITLASECWHLGLNYGCYSPIIDYLIIMFSNEDDGDACSGLLGRVGYRHNSSRVLSRRIDYGCEEGPRRTKITVENRTGKVIEGRYEVEKCCGMVLIRYRVRHAELKKFDSRYICAG